MNLAVWRPLGVFAHFLMLSLLAGTVFAASEACDWVRPKLVPDPFEGDPCCLQLILEKTEAAPPGPVKMEPYVYLELKKNPAKPTQPVFLDGTGLADSLNWEFEFLDTNNRTLVFFTEILPELAVEESFPVGRFCIPADFDGEILFNYMVYDEQGVGQVCWFTVGPFDKNPCASPDADCCDLLKAYVALDRAVPFGMDPFEGIIVIKVGDVQCDVAWVMVMKGTTDLGTYPIGPNTNRIFRRTFFPSDNYKIFTFTFYDSNGDPICDPIILLPPIFGLW